MKLNRIKFGVLSLLSGIVISLSLGGCVEQNELFDNGFLDPDMELGTYIDSTSQVKTSLFQVDSMNTSAMGIVFMGGINSEAFGTTRASAISNYFPLGFSDESLFGKDAVLDSMSIALCFSGWEGDPSYVYDISVHEILDTTFASYNYYYSDFDPEGHYSPESIFDFQLYGGDTIITGMLPRSFFGKLLENDYSDPENPYLNDTLFVDKFKGFYFKVNNYPSVWEEGAIHCMDLSMSSMQLYYHNFEAEADTTLQSYQFYLAMLQYPAGNNFTMIEHDYTTANSDYAGLINREIGDSTINTKRAFVQGLGGVGTKVELDTLAIERIKTKAEDLGFGHVGVHRATLDWYVEGVELGTAVSPQTLDEAAYELGIYYDFENMDLVQEYDPISESLYGSSYTSTLGATLNRSNKKYQMSIGQTIQQLFNKPDGMTYKEQDKYIVDMMPSYSEMLAYNETIMGGGNSTTNKPQLVIVYTLVK